LAEHAACDGAGSTGENMITRTANRWLDARGRHDALDALVRPKASRALAPDARRARLGEPDPTERGLRRRAARLAIGSGIALALVLLAPAIAHVVTTSDVARGCLARAIERTVSSQIGGRFTLGELDYVDAQRIVGRDVRIEDADGRAWLDLDAFELEYDAGSLLAGRLVSSRGTAKGGRVTLPRARPHDRDENARTDVVQLDRLETIDVAMLDSEATGERAWVSVRVAENGAVRVAATHL
jgi:hypothetical protein